MSDLLRSLLEKESKLKARIQLEQNRLSKEKRAADARAKIIVGAALLGSENSDDEARSCLKKILSRVNRMQDIKALKKVGLLEGHESTQGLDQARPPIKRSFSVGQEEDLQMDLEQFIDAVNKICGPLSANERLLCVSAYEAGKRPAAAAKHIIEKRTQDKLPSL